MQPMHITRFATAALMFVFAVFAMTSCRRAQEATEVAVETSAQSTNDMYVAEFQRLVTGSNMTIDATETEVNRLCWKISELPDKNEAIRLYDRLLGMAIAQEVTQTNLYHRENWYAKLWFLAMNSFCFAQGMQGNSFEYWDRMFMFFYKYVDEIVDVEMGLPSTDSIHWKRSDVEKGSYLHGLRGSLKTWVHVMRRYFDLKLSKGLTVEQKADVCRRLDELNKYTITPTNFPGGKR